MKKMRKNEKKNSKKDLKKNPVKKKAGGSSSRLILHCP